MSAIGSTPLQSGLSDESKPATSSLAAPFDPVPADEASRKSQDGETDEKKKKKLGLFGFGKKKAGESESTETEKTAAGSTEAPVERKEASPVQTESHHSIPTSPNRNALSSSPRLSSPAGSQIFERNVQEATPALMPNSPAIPSHVTTENFIPPVLDASTEAITDGHLSPDSVEIITHNAHQPAAVTVTGVSPLDPASSNWADELASFADRTDVDSASNYGSFDTTDVRRLSFISFADVVQAEQHGPSLTNASQDSVAMAGLTGLHSLGAARSPSPIRSPISSQPSPPTSHTGSVQNLELSPSRKPLGSPGLGPQHAGELNIETMSQALRRTGSADLSAVRSTPISPIEGPSH